MKHDLQGIFDALLEGVVILDAADRIEMLNPEARRLIGGGHDPSPGKTLGEALGPEHPVCRVVERVRASGRASIHDEIEFPQRFESPIPVDVSVSNIGESPAGQPSAIAIAMRDRSAARTLREEFHERERQESYGHIAAGIAHEVRNPLGGMALFAGLLREDLEGRDPELELLGRIEHELGVLERVVEEFLAYARSTPLETAEVRLSTLAAEVTALAGLTVTCARDATLTVDREQMRRLLLNLARNAAQAGATTLTLTAIPGGFDAHDDGPGLPPEIAARAFEAFFTTREKGTGLGLALCRKIAEAHGGTITLIDPGPPGARFRVTLPG